MKEVVREEVIKLFEVEIVRFTEEISLGRHHQ